MEFLIGILFTINISAYILDRALIDLSNKKNEIDNWWINIQSKKLSTVSIEINQKFVELFDVIYGRKTLSWRRVIASYISSIFAIFSLALIMGWEGTAMGEFTADHLTKDDMIIPILLIILINPIIDFISLAETRWVLDYMVKAKNSWLIMFYFVVDIFLTSIVILSGISILLFFYFLFTINVMKIFDAIYVFFMDKNIDLFIDTKTWGLFTMSTYFTSFFVVLFTVAAFLAKLLHSLFSFTPRFFYLIQATNRPYQIVAGGISIVVVVFYMMFYFLNLNLWEYSQDTLPPLPTR